MWVVQSEWEGEYTRVCERSCSHVSLRRSEGERDARRREWDKAMVRGSTLGPHLSSRCGLHSCPTQREKRRKRRRRRFSEVKENWC